MTHVSFLLFAAFIGLVSADPQILRLYKYTAGGQFTVDGIENGAKLYVASRDDPSLLRNITLTTGSTSITVDKLADFYDDGTPKYINISGNLLIRTLNTDSSTSVLSGFLYVTTYQQAHDPTFGVYVISDSQSINRDGMKTTSVVLNTELKTDSTDIDKPVRTSYVTNIQHSSNTNVYFRWGIPSSDWYTTTNNTFFENPVNFADYDQDSKQWIYTKQFFDHVEPLQINLDYWYFMSMGPINMQLENKYVSVHNYTTTAVNTTGLILDGGWFFKDQQVNFLLDRTRNRTAGTMISTFLTQSVTFLLDSDTSIVSQTYGSGGGVNYALSRSYFQATRLLVNSTSIYPGTFYCQYFGFSTELLPVTTNSPTMAPTTTGSTNTPMATTPTVATTTKVSSNRSYIDILMFLLATVLLR